MKYSVSILFIFFTVLSLCCVLDSYSEHAATPSITLEPSDLDKYNKFVPSYNGKVTFNITVSDLDARQNGFSRGRVEVSFSKVTNWLGIYMNHPEASKANSENDFRFYWEDQESQLNGGTWDDANWTGAKDSVSVSFEGSSSQFK